MSEPLYYFLYPDQSKLLIINEMRDEFKYKIFPISNEKINLTKNELDDFLFACNIKKKKINDEKSIDVVLKRSMSVLLNDKSIPELTRLSILIKKSQNVKLLRKLRTCDCIVLGKVDNSKIVIYRDEDNNVPIFSSDDFLKEYLTEQDKTILLNDGYKPLKVEIMKLEYLIGTRDINITIDPISINPKISFSLKLIPSVMEQIYD